MLGSLVVGDRSFLGNSRPFCNPRLGVAGRLFKKNGFMISIYDALDVAFQIGCKSNGIINTISKDSGGAFRSSHF